MRISTWLHLAALCVIAASAVATCSPLSARSIPPAAKKVVLQEEFQGYGLTLKDAEANALERACDWLGANANLGWTPTPNYLREKSMIHFGEPTEKKSDIAKEFGGRIQIVPMRLEVSADQARAIHKLAQQHRMKERQKLSLLVLIGVACLLGVVGGYLRLEEATKGYYTRLLRIAAISVLVAIVAGLYVVG